MPQVSNCSSSDSEGQQSDSENSCQSSSGESENNNSDNDDNSDDNTKPGVIGSESESGSNSDSQSASGGTDGSSRSEDSDNAPRSAAGQSESGNQSSSGQEEGNEAERESNMNSSRSSSHSKSSCENKSPKRFWEENPDVYGIRRSARERKQPESFTIQPKDKAKKKTVRRSSSQWNSSGASLSDDSDSDDGQQYRKDNRNFKRFPPKKKLSRNYSHGSDSDDRKAKRTSRALGSKVSYKEETEDDDDENEDLIEVDWSQQKEEENTQTIDRILVHRYGKRGAVGMQTYIYEVEKRGDPNSDFDPKDRSQVEMQFLVKWKGWAHIHNTWESEESLKTQKVKGYKKVENYLQKEREIQAWKNRASPEEVEYMEIQTEMERELHYSHVYAERIFAEAHENGNTYYYIKWQNLPYAEATWELEDITNQRFSKQLEKFKVREQSTCFPKQCPALKRRPKFSPMKAQPPYLGGGNEDLLLRDYQLDGLNWLIHAWCKHNSVILADEMGLGKTIQTIAFLSYLFHAHDLYGPFLLVLPLSTLNAWQREFDLWAPDINVIVYIGDRDSRKIIHDYEWVFGSRRIKFNAVLTTYEILLRDKEVLQDSCQWSALMIDEAHRLKNEDSQLYQALLEFKTNHRLLITGTPLQNSLKELWALLHFIMPEKFNDWEYFESQHDGENKERGFHRLHRQLEPYLLRRVKKDVEKSLPAKVEQILRVDMTQLQKQYYKWILTKNYDMLRKGNRGSKSSFVNIVMELKKCCNHSLLIRQMEDIPNTPNELLQQLLRGSGKLLLLDKLLVRLNETGHRVLIFSQMVRMLDILAQYLQYRRFPFQRLDGSISGDLRRQALDHFNAPGSLDFCFLLSTRAGGLGINLATADTVIIFDSDWNPQNDLQAQARAHRIGQKNQVNIYRLVTKNSIEETIIERAKQKMVLDHLVIQSMDTSGRTIFNKNISNATSTPFNKEELNAILKFGAEELFKDDEENEEDPVCDIDEILRRAETRDEGPASAGDELLSAFKVASFNLDEEEDVSKLDSLPDDSNKEWDDIIPENFRSQVAKEEKEKEMADLYLPPRVRKTLKQDGKGDEEVSSPTKKRKKESDSSGEEDSDGEKPRKRGRPRMYHKEVVKGFTDPEVRRFFKSFKKFGNPMRRLDTIANDADMREKSADELRRLGETILERCRQSLADYERRKYQEKSAEAANDGPVKRRDRGPSFKLSGVAINARTTLSIIEEMHPLDFVVPHAPVERASWNLPIKRVKDAHWDTPWVIQDDSRLLRGIFEYGMGSWEQLKGDPALGLGEKILLEGDLKPQAKHLENRVQYLLKLIKKTQIIHQPKIRATRVIKPKKVKEPKGISKEIIENDDSSDEGESPIAAPVASLGPKKTSKESGKEEKEHVKEVREQKLKTKEDDPHRKDEEPKEKHNDKKKKKKRKKVKKEKQQQQQGPLHITANGEPIPVDSSKELDQGHPHWLECKEKMRPMKKPLRMLDNPNESLSQEEQIQHTRRCLIQIGDHIEKALQLYQNHDVHKEWKNLLWQFVSKFTEYDAKKLHKLYKKHKKLSEEKKEGGGGGGSSKEEKKDHKKERGKHKHGDKKNKTKDGGDFHHSQKRRTEEDGGTAPNKKPPYNGWSNDRSRDGEMWSERDKQRDRDKHKDKDRHRDGRERDRGYQRGHGGGSRDWHGNSSGNRESRYPEDFKRETGGYHRDVGFKSHGGYGGRAHGEWAPRGTRPAKHAPSYPAVVNYGSHYQPHSGGAGGYGMNPGGNRIPLHGASHPGFGNSHWGGNKIRPDRPDWPKERTDRPNPDWPKERTDRPNPDWPKERTDRPNPDWPKERTERPNPDWPKERTDRPNPDWAKKDPRHDSSRQDLRPYQA